VTLLKWPLAEISAIAKFARHEADFHGYCVKRLLGCSLKNIKIPLFQQKFLQVKPSFANFAKNLDLVHITLCTGNT